MSRKEVQDEPTRCEVAGECSRSASLTPLLRQRMEAKRHSLKLSLQEAAHLLNVHWTTYRKWERGQSLRISNRNFAVLQQFISGDFDLYVHPQGKGSASDENDSLQRCLHTDSALGQLVRRLCDIYLLLEDEPAVRRRLCRDLESCLATALHFASRRPE